MKKKLNHLLKKTQNVCKWSMVAILCIFLTFIIIAGSCEKPNPDKPIPEDESIIGSWKLVELKYPLNNFTGDTPVTIVDYSNDSIIFTFKEDSALFIAGSMSEGYLPEGEYTYIYKIIIGDELSMPGPNLTINNKGFFGKVSEQKKKLSIWEMNDRWGINLIKLNSNE
jgi:hypothetical protein